MKGHGHVRPIHGAGDSGWYWHLVAAELGARGHDVLAPDLPADQTAELGTYADAVVGAIGTRTELVVVGQSFGAFTAPLVCDRLPAELLVFVAGMIPHRVNAPTTGGPRRATTESLGSRASMTSRCTTTTCLPSSRPRP